MKKHIILFLMAAFWASAAAGQEVRPEAGEKETVLEGKFGPTYNWVSVTGSGRADEYEYLKDTVGGNLHLEYDPLPNRFETDTYYLNKKDYFSDTSYAYRDVVMMNFLGRGLYHNLDHLKFGQDDPTTPSPSFTDLNASDTYAVDFSMMKGYVRLKMPDYPMHLYAEATQVERNGTIQQVFLRGYTGGLNIVSQSRNIDWQSEELKIGVNSHIGPVEADYSHTGKKFHDAGDRVLYDNYTNPDFSAAHNLVPDLTSSTDTVKLHTSLTGRVVVSATYSDGTKKNDDSGAKSDFQNGSGDLVLTPLKGLLLTVKYRHYDVNNSDPATVTVSSIAGIVSSNTYTVRDAISSKRDIITGGFRYRLTDRMSVKGEYQVENINRDLGNVPSEWEVAPKTTKFTGKLGLTYRVSNQFNLRLDGSTQTIENPAYADDPDRVYNGKTTLTWTPWQRMITLVTYGISREKRNDMAAPLAGGSRSVDRDQVVGSVTFLVGRRSSVTGSYMFYQNRALETLTFTQDSGLYLLESSVPYGDKAQVFTLSASHAPFDRVLLTADASKCYAKGRFRLDGTVPGTEGIDTFSDMNVVENILMAGMSMQFSNAAGTDIRYQYREYHDKIDNTQDGRANTALAMVYVKW